MTYERLGSLRTHPGKREEVVAILLSGLEGLAAVGCIVYDVSLDLGNEDLIWVREVWVDLANHRASLQLPETRAAIGAAMPLLTGEFTGAEIRTVGGVPS